MKKYLLSFALIIAFAFYVMLENQSTISIVSSSPENGNSVPTTGSATSSSPTPAARNTTITSETAGTPSTALYRNGSYSGDLVNAYFGNIQVEAVISDGKLANVEVPTYPNDRSTSIRINNAALPKLVQEAIISQNAQVDIVSGATQTSQAFQQSLASALAKAKS